MVDLTLTLRFVIFQGYFHSISLISLSLSSLAGAAEVLATQALSPPAARNDLIVTEIRESQPELLQTTCLSGILAVVVVVVMTYLMARKAM